MDGDRYRWQDAFKARYLALNKENFTLVACPGAGKTRATMKLARELMETRVIDYLWIVCPTRQVKKQWWRAAGDVGLDIEWKWENSDGAVSPDMSGVAVTYSQVGSQPSLHRRHVGTHRTLVIFDEIHHADEEHAWGIKSQDAFGPAVRRIMLSGTPYRPQGKIAFVEYDPDDGYVKPDFAYTYDVAQQDFVCRPIYFPRTGGNVEWEWREQSFSHTFEDEISKAKAAQRLRASLCADFETINPIAEQLLTDADAKLSQLRNEGETTAGGLVIAMNIDHAHAVAEHLRRMFGRRPPVVASDDPGALNTIQSYRESTERWLVSINMVSEGVDIPRLRVLAYLTNVTSSLYFDQAAGRICRGVGDAFFFIPDDEVLRDLAQRLADLRKHALEITEGEIDTWDDWERTASESGFKSIGGEAESAGIIFGSHRIDKAEYEQAVGRLITDGWRDPVPHEVVGKWVVNQRGQDAQTVWPQGEELTGGLRSERKEKLREVQNRMIRKVCMQNGYDYATVNANLNKDVGIRRLKHATEEQLVQRLKLAQELSSECAGAGQ